MSYKQTHPKFIDLPSSCGCFLGEKCRGSGGWHLKEEVSPFSDEPTITAYERCPAYWKAAGRVVDPSDRLRLISSEKTKTTRRVRV